MPEDLMVLQLISLINFRNYSKASFDFSPTTTLVIGPNTSGKTNLLEAIYFLATGKSFGATYDREAIHRGDGLAHLAGVICRSYNAIHLRGGRTELELAILANENGENTSSKRFKVNGVKKRLSDFAGNLRAVYFGPEEIQLVTGSPSRRRKYMDAVLIQVDREYARVLSEYEKVLRQRNRLLVLLRERGERGTHQRRAGRGELEVWDEKLAVLGPALSKKRREMFADFNAWLEDSGLCLLFVPRPWSNESKFREREIAAGMTLWGPHREDFVFQCKMQNAKCKNDRRDLSRFGSRGEQRLAVLHLKLAELEFIAERTDERPILLLDDIFSELDEGNRGLVLELFGKQQTIVTATDLDQIDGEKLKQHKVLRLQ